MALLAPSILSSDFSRIAESVAMLEKGGADMIHIDVMDGHFVPNLTVGPQLVSSLREKTSLPIDVHLMVENPGHFVPQFHHAGAQWISIHLEASVHLHRDIAQIKDLGCKSGLALNPATPVHLMNDIFTELDFVLIMSVNPGWGSQKFIEASRSKISHLRNWIDDQKLDILIEVDGGIKLDNMQQFIDDGTDILVVGSGIFKADDPEESLRRMRTLLEENNRT